MKIVIEGVPIAKNRHRCGCRGRKPISYDPQILDEMKTVRHQIIHAWNAAFQSNDRLKVIEASNLTKVESYEVGFTFLFPINKSDPGSQKNAKLWGLIPYNQRPDSDNLAKLYMDCATGVIWNDDAIVDIAYVKRGYSEFPRTEMEIMAKKNLKVTSKTEEFLKILSPTRLKELWHDLHEIISFSPAQFDRLVDMGMEEKEKILDCMANILITFSALYADDFKKLQKLKGNEHEQRT